jgi:autophagy-related protein 27
MNGGAVPLDGPKEERRKQSAIIELICNKNMTGKEGEVTPEDKYHSRGIRRREHAKEGEGNHTEPDSTQEKQLLRDNYAGPTALKFVSYGSDKGDTMLDVLRLTWETKHACEGVFDAPDEDAPQGSHWGIFTWLVIMSVAAK